MKTEYSPDSAQSLHVREKMMTSRLFAVCEDGSIYELKGARVRSPVHAHEAGEQLRALLRPPL